MKTLTKLAWKKQVGSTAAGAILGAGAGEVKHRRNLAQGKESSRAKNIAGGAVGGGVLGGSLGAAHTHLSRGAGGAGGSAAKNRGKRIGSEPPNNNVSYPNMVDVTPKPHTSPPPK